MITYDSKVIQEFAEDLYSRAGTIVFANTVVLALGGAAAGYLAFGKVGGFVGLLIAGGIGYYLGTQKAFLLKLQAQTALCQAQIEKNTRNPAPEPVLSIQSIEPGAVAAKDEAASEPGPLGRCPNCGASIPLRSEECPHCVASFAKGSAWHVEPL